MGLIVFDISGFVFIMGNASGWHTRTLKLTPNWVKCNAKRTCYRNAGFVDWSLDLSQNDKMGVENSIKWNQRTSCIISYHSWVPCWSDTIIITGIIKDISRDQSWILTYPLHQTPMRKYSEDTCWVKMYVHLTGTLVLWTGKMWFVPQNESWTRRKIKQTNQLYWIIT